MNEPQFPTAAGDTPSAPVGSLPTEPGRHIASLGDSPADADQRASDLPEVPGYRVLREIARGGMGRVLAARDLALERDVALKILLPGADAERFVRESKITARLPHPGVPPVHALGKLADGSPFLAMKLIAGQTLAAESKTADRPRLLQAFAQVCQAVGFAHSRGIIHRDLKPANVMVGAFGEVQVMDWGLAKELANPDAPVRPRPESTPAPAAAVDAGQTVDYGAAGESTDDQTQAGLVMGTPSYMAPEQARGEPVDSRADVFALGGMLCALLTGKPPFQGASAVEIIQRAAKADLADALARLEGCDADPEVIALCRRCLSATPADRPPNGQAVADELRAHLDGVQERLRAAELARAAETARAAEATRTATEANERAKAERRARRVLVAAAGLVLLVLAGGIVGTTIGLFRAEKAKENAQLAEGETRKRAAELKQVADYQAKMLKQVDPADAGIGLMADLRARHAAALAKDKEISEAERSARAAAIDRELNAVNSTDAATALLDRMVLAPAAQTITAQFADQPLVDASLRHTLGVAYFQLGRHEEALALHRRAHELRAAALGEKHRDTLAALAGLVDALIALQRLDEAENSLTRLLEAYRATLGPDHPDTLNALVSRGSLLRLQGKFEEWEACCRDVLERSSRVFGKDHLDTLRAMNALGMCLLFRDKYAEAERLLRTALEEGRRMPGQRFLDGALDNLARALRAQGKAAEAEPYLREALATSRRERGDDHPNTLMTLHNLAVLLQSLGKLDEAEPLAREALEKTRRVRGNEHRETLVALNVMGRGFALQGKYAEAEPYWREALTTGRRALGEDHPDTIAWINNLGSLLTRQNKLTEAEPLVHEALAKFRKAHGADHSSAVVALGNLGALQRDLGKLAEAEASFREALERNQRTQGAENPNTLMAILRLGDMLATRGKSEEAAALLAPAEAKVRTAFPGANAYLVASLLEDLGRARGALAKSTGAFADAEANLLEAHAIYVQTRGPNSKEALACAKTLAEAYAAWDKAEPGHGYDAKAAAWKSRQIAAPK